MRRAVFLDRDGTLVRPRHYPSRPADLVLFPGVAGELAPLQEAGFRLVMVTNQSGLARGYFDEPALRRMHDHLADLLASSGVQLDGIYYCPHHVDGVVPELAIACNCRKPQAGMLFRAATDFDLDLARSWLVGDILDDVEAGNRAGCRTILVDLGTEPLPDAPLRWPDYVARDTCHALRILRTLEFGGDEELDYRPPVWRADPTPTFGPKVGLRPPVGQPWRGESIG